MPEIKNQFTGGKMNKDLDERLVPKGEYRDAMNIQVSTSEGSDVGAVQNILGNMVGCPQYTGNPSHNPISSDSFVVGSVADEKSDSLYWLVSGESYTADTMVENNTWSGDAVVMKDLIFRKNGASCEPVFVDVFAFSQPYSSSSNNNTLSGVALDVVSQLQVGWTVTGVTDEGEQSNEATVVDLGSSQTNAIGVEFGFTTTQTTIATSSYVGNNNYAVADGILIPMSSKGPGHPFTQTNSNIVYIMGFNGTPSSLIGDTINIHVSDNYSGTPQSFQILNAANLTIVFSGLYGMDVVKVTLDNNLVNFTPALDQPTNNAGTSSHPHTSAYGGKVISAYITGTNVVGTNIADGKLYYGLNTTLPAAISTTQVGDLAYMDGVAYYVSVVDLAAGYITLATDSSLSITHAGWQVGGMLYGVPQFTGGEVLLSSLIEIQLDTNLDLSDSSLTYTSLLYRGPRTLNFNHNKYVTGINIIDDMLFWTDGVTEPKKINIPRSVEGSKNPTIGGSPDGFAHTRLINKTQDIGWWDNIPVREEHITVIKKAPLSAPSIKSGTDVADGVVGGNGVTFDLSVSSSAVGENRIMFPSDSFYGFKKGDVIRLAQALEELPENYDIRVEVMEIDSVNDEYLIKILSLSADADVTNNTWFGELESIGSFLFERKLPRFAYRYKYLDNEYSSFSPFTNVAFFPGEFRYQSIQAYNTGMQNTIRTLSITDFITSEMPKDVKSIDLLYKNETSPIIYLLDTVSNDDESPLGENSWNSIGTHDIQNSRSGSYEVKTESISQALPSNQSLRSWDNVPKRAKAQEISGGRIIYGNYTQGYDIKNSSGQTISPDISTVVVSNVAATGSNLPSKSIKSLRNYEVGVVWGDKYGRETPVITSRSGSVLVPKSKSKSSNHLKVSLDSSPNWADYYRFYVKETSNEYYNLAVDRMYDADDGNIWVSFPSVDRNKVDEETYLILKKGADKEELVEQEGRYKVVAIENEAPDYIKTSYDLIVRTNQDGSRKTDSCHLWGGSSSATLGCSVWPQNGNANPPVVGRKSFSIGHSAWTGAFDTATKEMGLTDLITQFKEVTSNAETINNEMYVSFTKEVSSSTGTEVTSGDKYRVIDIKPNSDETSPMGESGNNLYIIHLEKPIGLKDEFVVQDTEGGTTSPAIGLEDDDIHILFWQQTVTNKPEFDGRFFVKILNDTTAQANLSKTTSVLNSWVVAASPSLYKIGDSIDGLGVNDELTDHSDSTYNFSPNSIAFDDASYAPGGGGIVGDEMDDAFGNLNHLSEWVSALLFGGSTLRSRWFIDSAPFAGLYNDNSDTYTTSFTDGSGNSHNSCDTSSTMMVTHNPSHNHSESAVAAFGTGQSFGRVGMKGIHTTGGSNYIDLSFSQLTPNTAPHAIGTWDIGNPSTNTSMDEYKSVVDRLVINSRFKLMGGEGIFKIKGITKRRLLNFMGAPTIQINGVALQPITGDYTIGPLSGTFTFQAGTVVISPQAAAQRSVLRRAYNKRFSYRIKYELDADASPDGTTIASLIDEAGVSNISNTVPGSLQFLTEYNEDEENKISYNPAIFETEPKEDFGLDLYYEASSSLPVFPLNNKNKHLFIPLGTTIVSPSNASFPDGIFITNWNSLTTNSERIVTLSMQISIEEYNALHGDSGFVQFLRDDGTYVTATLTQPTITGTTTQLSITPKNEFGLNWHNCWSFNNGVESNRIGDTFNKPYLGNGVTLSTTAKDSPGEESRSYGLIYSGIYNSNSSVNDLNQFIAAEKITKDINPMYGSIQKLYSGWGQGGDLIALCEDRILKILADKDALFNADGNPQLTSTNSVLGQAIPYSGEHGISKNPESFASEAYRIYFTDKVRGAVMRLSMDGLTPISDHGMKDWFRDNLKLNQFLIGSFDDKKDEYNITLKQVVEAVSFPEGITVSFKESVKGWTSFKSFVPDSAISCANEYYTFKGGLLWQHHSETEDRNTFYKGHPSNGFVPSSINVILNDSPSVVKTFHTLNYEGSQSKVNTLSNYNDSSGNNVFNNEYYNLQPKDGWKVQDITTDQEQGSLNEFIEKEGKWFNYIRGKAGSVLDPDNNFEISSGFNNADFAFQGLGLIAQASISTAIVGCTANGSALNNTGIVNDLFGDGQAAFNYDPLATLPNNASCFQTIFGCTDSFAANYTGNGVDANGVATSHVNVDDGSCNYLGCTNPGADNYAPWATVDDGSCIFLVLGCTDATASNYNSVATTDDGSCIPWVYGCMDATADNYDTSANQQWTSSTDTTNPCFYLVYGCTDPTSCNYNSLANTLVFGSCSWCNDPLANNYDGLDAFGNPYSCDNGCLYCGIIANLMQINGGSNTDTTINVQWDETWSGSAPVNYYEITYSDGTTTNTITNIQPNTTQGTVGHSISGLTPNTPYTITVEAICSSGTSPLNSTYNTTSGNSAAITITTAITQIIGCTDSLACDYDPLANSGNPSQQCDYTSCVGCQDPNANNYDATAILPGYCSYTAGCMDAAATNYDATLVADCNGDLGGSATTCCTYPVPGCMDGSLAMDGVTNAASNYNASATIDDGSCQYIDPVLWDQIPTTGQSALLSTPGWWTGGVWGGWGRKLRVYWFVGKSPIIDKNNIKEAYQSSFDTTNTLGDITSFQTPGVARYSNDNGISWSNLSSWNGTDPIQLIQADRTASTLKVPFVGNEHEYPREGDLIGSDGAQQQAMQFGFLNLNIPVFQTPIAVYNVLLGCNGGTGPPPYENYFGPIAFYDNTLCNVDPDWDPDN